MGERDKSNFLVVSARVIEKNSKDSPYYCSSVHCDINANLVFCLFCRLLPFTLSSLVLIPSPSSLLSFWWCGYFCCLMGGSLSSPHRSRRKRTVRVGGKEENEREEVGDGSHESGKNFFLVFNF
jgi:hypothetical protein